MSLLAWLGFGEEDAGHREPEAVEKIMQPLLALGEERARFLALFAFVLARVADVDEVSEVELLQMRRELMSWGNLPEAQAEMVSALAKAESRRLGATQHFLATRELRDLATREEKVAILHCLFAVSAADDSISGPEEEEIRRIARELLLTNDEYLGIRSAWSAKRSVMKLGPRG